MKKVPILIILIEKKWFQVTSALIILDKLLIYQFRLFKQILCAIDLLSKIYTPDICMLWQAIYKLPAILQ